MSNRATTLFIDYTAREGAHIIVPYRDEDDMRHLKVMGDLGKIVPMEIHLRNKDSLEAAIRHSDTVYNLLGRDYETRYEILFSFWIRMTTHGDGC